MPFDLLNIRQNKPRQGKAIIYWLGGSGFVFQFSGDEIICVDPYLSDSVERLFGFRRLSLAPIKAGELVFDLLFLTHDHADHLDIDSFDTIVKTNPGCRILTPRSCAGFLETKKAAYELISPGTLSQMGNVSLKTVAADHGELCPDALGFIISFAGRSLYFTGDTAFNENLMAEAIDARPEIVIPCINGAYGNMNEKDAATLVGKCQAKTAVPSHFWFFAEHGEGCPAKFRDLLKSGTTKTEVILLTPGRGVEI